MHLRKDRPLPVRHRSLALAVALGLAGAPAVAFEALNFSTPGLAEDLRGQIKSFSALTAAKEDDRTSGQDILAAALSDYGIVIETLYANGYYAPVVSIRLDGREASEIPLLSTPATVDRVDVTINSGPRYQFGTARLQPLAPRTELPADFRSGERAKSTTITDAAQAGIDGWRDLGFAKADLVRENVVAVHPERRVDVDLGIDTGPRLRFGRLNTDGDSYVRSAAQRRIAGLPEGEMFDPEDVDRSVDRLTRTGAFATVTLREAEVPNPDGTLDMELEVTDAKPRRFGFGAELSSLEGVTLSTFWLHRNLLGGAERFRVDAEVSDISNDTNGIDARLGARLDVPGAIGPETDAFFRGEIAMEQEPAYDSDSVELGAGLSRRISDTLSAEIGLGYLYAETEDDLGKRSFSLVTLPLSLTWNTRDSDLDPRNGWYVNAEATPFLDTDGDGNGARLYADLRGYYALGERERTVLAGRLQIGSVIGPEIEDTPPDFLFFSGGAGSVRGQPYQSLDVNLRDGVDVGGRSFVGLSGEIRQDIGESLGLVAFADAGYVGEDSMPDDEGNWHSGAGVGVRYKTGLGPLRLDVASPVGGDTGKGVQIYLGIGQSF